MAVDRGWVWRAALLASLMVTAVGAQDEQTDAEVSDADEDLSLDEEELRVLLAEEEEEEAAVTDRDETGMKPKGDQEVSFQVTYKTPVPTGEVYFVETFDDGSLDRWQLSKTVKGDADEEISKYDGKWAVEPLKENRVPGDQGLVLKSRAKHHAIAALLAEPFVFRDQPLVVQYEVNFQDGIDCGGAYLKLLSDSGGLDLEQFQERTPYTIMFGPDKCGEDYKLHFIFRHRNPLTQDWEEKHAKRPDVDLKKFYTDRRTHLYTLVLNADSSYEMFIDQSSVSRGSLLRDVVPPVNPPKEVDDPGDSKPDDWDERAKIPDPEAAKPADWDEDAPAKIEDPDAAKPEGWLDQEEDFIPDPGAEKPEDWDEEMDGEWEAPQIPNPACETAPGCGRWKRPMMDNPEYRGKWRAPLVDNPSYQGVWKPRKISNPDYFEDLHPFAMSPFRALGLELWSMTADIYFDNFIVTSRKEVADRWASDSWGLKKLAASANEPGILTQLMAAAEERPWLWLIYLLTVGLPVGLLVLFCWPKKAEDDYTYRKTDVAEAEAKEEEEEDEDTAAEEEEEAGEAADAAEEDEGEAEDLAGEEEEEEEEKTNAKQPSDEELKEEEEEEVTQDSPKQTVRKRRARKD